MGDIFNRLTAIIFIVLLYQTTLTAQPNPNTAIKVGLALSGGGARGIAHIGVLQALEEEGIQINYIAGSSMGSVVGGLYAAGYSAEQLRAIVHEIDWASLFDDDPVPESVFVSERLGIMEPLLRLRFDFWRLYIPPGLKNGQRISNLLFKYLARANYQAGADFDSLHIPFRAVAVDASSGETLSLNHGELSRAVQASMAIPVYFFPVSFGDRKLIDGGVTNILPADAVRGMGADVVISSDVVGLFPVGEQPRNVLDIAEHALDISIRELKKSSEKKSDVIIRPELGRHSAYDYTKLDSLIEAGYRATTSQMKKIKQRTAGDTNHVSKRKSISGQTIPDGQIIDSIIIHGRQQARKSLILTEFGLKAGQAFDLEKAERGTERIYSTGLFENVWLELTAGAGGKINIHIHVSEKYPRTINFGVNYNETDDFSGFIQIAHFNFFGWGERFMPFIRLGKTLNKAGLSIVNDRFFATPATVNNEAYYELQSPFIYNNVGRASGRLIVHRRVVRFSAGIQPARKWLILGGLKFTDNVIENNSTFNLNRQSQRYGLITAHLIYDSRDDSNFPDTGTKFLFQAENSFEYADAAKFYSKFETHFVRYFKLSLFQTLITSAMIGTSKKAIPVYEKFRIGGPFDLPGYNPDELWGRHTAGLRLGYRINFYKRWYLLTNFSLSEVSDEKISFENPLAGYTIGLQVDAPVGPIHLLYGYANDNRHKVYFKAGYAF